MGVFTAVFALTATFFTSFSEIGIISATAGISSSNGAKDSETAVAVMRTKCKQGMQTSACLNLNNQTKAINFYRNSAMLSWRRGLAGLSGVIADPKQASQGLPTG